jgi:hypothetical protein
MSQVASTDTADDAAVTDDDKQVDDFDAERAQATILKQRESEKAALAKAKALEKELAAYKSAEDAKAEAEKALEVKVTERDQTISSLQGQIASLQVKHDFLAKAVSKGVADPALAFLAAKEQGLLGVYDPKEGTVAEHDFEKLGELYPSFQVSAEAASGDAGARGRGKATTTSQQFNQAVRGAIGR